jgi:hypothetical protein
MTIDFESMELVRDGLMHIEQERGSAHCGILYRFSCRRLTEFDELLQITESNCLVLFINDEQHLCKDSLRQLPNDIAHFFPNSRSHLSGLSFIVPAVGVKVNSPK